MNSKEAAAVTATELDEDVILQIVVRLPLKCAIRCMVLNKSLCRLISQRKKALVSSACPDSEVSIFCTTVEKITPGCSTMPITNNMRYHPDNPTILDSCNGVLLLEFETQRQICVFNPITSEIMPISSLIKFRPNDYNARVALAVDLDAHTIFQFKLVVTETLFHYEEEEEEEDEEEGTLWRFTVFVPSGGGTHWMKKSPVEFICGGNPCKCDRFVYAHGCMYYADEYNQRITVFDVEKENAKNIGWPRADIYNNAILSRSLDGSLQCAYVLDDEIKIHSYDQVKDVWELKHKITRTVSSPRVLFCNGQRLLISDDPWHVRKFAKVFHMYDITSDKWEKIDAGNCSLEMYLPATYFSFVPTLAKVSDKYLHDPEFEFAEVFLRWLQRLVMQETRDA